MNQASFRFYSELTDFLNDLDERGQMAYQFWGRPAVKDAIEAIGVPHTEVALILVNGRPASFELPLQPGDNVSVFPTFRELQLGSALRLMPAPLVQPAFIADTHLGRLSRYLRMIGFSCLYQNEAADAQLARTSAEQDRILLTRDQELLKRSIVQRGYYLRSQQPKQQLVEVVRRYQLSEGIRPFRLCMECDGSLVEVDKQQVVDRIPDQVQQEQHDFRQCQRCRRVYWRGSHVDRMQQLIQWLRERVG